MHDPMVVAFELRRPWPKIRKLTPNPSRLPTFSAAFWRFRTVELYWPGLITVWHVEPGGADAGTVCTPADRRRHLRHWKIQVHPWQHFRRWAFTRCSWCSGRSRRGDPVNVSSGWGHDSTPTHWWQSERGLFHRDCASTHHAHRTCICSLADGGPWSGGGWGDAHGTCGRCGGFRPMGVGERADYLIRMKTIAMLQGIPSGHRDPATTAEVERVWQEHRAALAAEKRAAIA